MSVWRWWVAGLARVEEGTSLALLRIAVGLVVAGDLAVTWRSGALALLWTDVRHDADGYRRFSEGGIVGLLGGATPEVVGGIAAVAGLAALVLAAGIAPRVAAFVALQGCIALFGLNPLAGGGHDRLATNALWLLVLADSARTLSLGCRLRTGTWTDPTPVPAWPRYLVVLQLVVTYTTTGIQKAAPEWFPLGDLRAVYHMLLVPGWARFDLAPVLGPLAPLTQVATAATWVWESTFWVVGLALLSRDRSPRGALARWDLRGVYAIVGIAFHVGLAVLTNLGPFSAISLALYPCLWHPDEWRRAWARVAGAWGRGKEPGAEAA